MWISWKHQDTDFDGPLSFDQKVEVFYEQTLGWQLHIADLVASGGRTFGEDKLVTSVLHSGFAVLHICLSYFELVGSLVNPGLSYKETFKVGVQQVLPGFFDGSADGEALLARLYVGARCGLYHCGRTGPDIGLGQPDDGRPMGYDSRAGKVVISPERLPQALKLHMEQFRLELLSQSNTDLRGVFEERFDAGFIQRKRSTSERKRSNLRVSGQATAARSPI
jgi:hypothetical protein